MDCSCQTNGLGGLGITSGDIQTFFTKANGGFEDIINNLTSIADTVIPGFQQAKTAYDEITTMFGIGSGRREADMIVPVQNQIASRLGFIDNIVGHDAMGTSDLNVLHAVLKELEDTRRYWFSFINDHNNFTDGRASQQAANDIMPLIDGTGNYSWPTMVGSMVTADRWGNPTNGGRIGAVQRRITQLGGDIFGGGITIGGTTISVPVLVIGGIAAYYAFFKKGR